ncbi:hypothetical protein NITGR_360015 [Nitrospina gracilis 3/211]|uniref:Uncharacterized protein n=1 Tax=Nitrospina gracilis (strain 3/211) TaxID=1266370 RepID=M1YJN7_NITG3|nr:MULTISPECIES: hypothetical protein [Nitrospina]MCF8723597.1 hypothetical protein [Nitrospina sp. Nb-3]CCQ90677.1 hypothetical protein NITGR_360015 [Nitrospina gracilis 3/211]
MIADIALPTMEVLVKKGVRHVLIPLKKKHPGIYQSLGKSISQGRTAEVFPACAGMNQVFGKAKYPAVPR